MFELRIRLAGISWASTMPAVPAYLCEMDEL